jgi:DNA-binding response OmpR family regulator
MPAISQSLIQVVLVENEEDLREEIVSQLNHHGFDAHGCADANALYRFLCARPDAIVVLEFDLPGEDGLAICRYLRDARPLLPIVMASAGANRRDRIMALEAGADVYLCKPFDIEELRFTLRRLHERTAQWLSANARGSAALPQVPHDRNARARSAAQGDQITGVPSDQPATAWRFDVERMMLIAPNDEQVRLSVVELRIMLGLIRAAGGVCSYSDLIADDDPLAETCQSHRLEVIISRLRGKSARVAGEPLPVKTVRGRGYRLENITVL